MGFDNNKLKERKETMVEKSRYHGAPLKEKTEGFIDLTEHSQAEE
jgi:hypothetical protein